MSRLLLFTSCLVVAIAGPLWLRSRSVSDLFVLESGSKNITVVWTSEGNFGVSLCQVHRRPPWTTPHSGARYVPLDVRPPDGSLALCIFGTRISQGGPPDYQLRYVNLGGYNFAGFGFQKGTLASRVLNYVSCCEFAVPLWAIIAVFSTPVIRTVRRTVATRRQLRHNNCVICNYDLRATKDRCPECGHPIPAAAPDTAPPAAPN